MKRCLLTATVVVLSLAPLAADLTLTQIMTIEGGSAGAMMADKPVTVQTRIKGQKARADIDAVDTKITTLTDLATKEVLLVNHGEKSAQLVSAMAPAAGVPAVPPVDIDVTFTPTGQTREIEGVQCTEHAFKMSVGFAQMAASQAGAAGQPQLPKEAAEMLKDVTMVMQGSVWVSASAPGASEYMAFQKAAAAANLAGALGGVFGGRQSPGGMDKLLAAVTGAPGLPYLTEMTMAVEGTGPFVEMMKGTIGGMKMTQKTTAVSTDPLADDLFTVPAGYTIKK